MPTYSYVCDACNYHFEKFQAMTDEPIQRCPSCGDKRVRRLIGAGAGLIFKGSGFYLTDYARKSSPDTSHNDNRNKKQPEKSKDSSESSSVNQESKKQ